jgi:peptide/nickel transport system ATP-binding protein
MRDGQIVETGPTREVYENPQHPYTQQLVSTVPSLRRALAGTIAAEAAEATAGTTPTEPVLAGTAPGEHR